MPSMRDIDWRALADAVASDDIDAALALGLLGWDGDAALPRGAGVDETDVAMLGEARDARRQALAARERYRARETRLARLQSERRQRQTKVLAPRSAGAKPALGGAAAAALARALAKAGR